jgi:hypothetical protein
MQNDGNLVEYMASGWAQTPGLCALQQIQSEDDVLDFDIGSSWRGCELRRDGARLPPCAKHRRTESALYGTDQISLAGFCDKS